MRGINKVILLGVISYPDGAAKHPAAGYLRFDVGVRQKTADGGETIISIPCLVSGRLAEIMQTYAVENVTMIYLEGSLRPFEAGMVVAVNTIQIVRPGEIMSPMGAS